MLFRLFFFFSFFLFLFLPLSFSLSLSLYLPTYLTTLTGALHDEHRHH